MTRRQLEHVIRAAGTIANVDDLVIIGSQAILGQYPDAPAELTQSNEADLYPRDEPDLADLIEGSIGELSPFHDTFGYYAQAVGPETACLPEGWTERLVPARSPATRGVTGWCLEVHDLAVAKLVAGREKDLDFLAALGRHGLVTAELVAARLSKTRVEPEVASLAAARLHRLLGTPAN